MPIPAIPADLRKGIFVRNIERKPTGVMFRNQSRTARFEEPTLRRKVMLAGYTQEVADRECMIALETGEDRPLPHDKDDEVTITDGHQNGEVYRVIDVQDDIGADCYTLTLARRNS